jgi:hypothetical protein
VDGLKAIGKKRDTIYLIMIPIFDTLTYQSDNNKIIDSLVISYFPTPRRISMGEYTISLIASGGQTVKDYPHKLYFHHNRLYEFDSLGHIRTDYGVPFWDTHHKCPPWYEKIK